VRLDWLYPELKRIDPRDRISALHKAKEGPFDAIELIGIGIALVLVVGLTRYSVTGMGLVARVGAALANFIVAIPLLLIFAGPFYVRRVRRGLREYIQTSSRPKADQTQ
jgi:hypothetical protein